MSDVDKLHNMFEKILEHKEPKIIKEYEKECDCLRHGKYMVHCCEFEDGSVSYFPKNCPKCEVPIFKTEGCDHMWCTECHTMFNWSDLKITKTTTNPLYFEWLRSQGITPERYNHPDAQPYIHDCERQLSFNDCMKIISSYDFKNKEKLINFISNIELKVKPLNDGRFNMYRIKYVFKFITKSSFEIFPRTPWILFAY